MSNITETISKEWETATGQSGITGASHARVDSDWRLDRSRDQWVDGAGAARVIAGGLGTIIAGLVRNTLLVNAWEAAGMVDAGTPILVVAYALVASLAGSLAADRIALLLGEMPSVVLGGFAGLLSAVLFALLVIAYRMVPERQGARP